MFARRGSILIWTVFLGLFIAVFFIAFQSRLEQYFSQTKQSTNIFDENRALAQALDSLRQKAQIGIPLSNTKNLESTDFGATKYTLSLPAGYATELRLTKTGGVTSLPITITEGGPVKYLSVNAVTWAITSSGIIFDSYSGAISDSPEQIIYLENLGGFVRLDIGHGSTDLMPTVTHYTESFQRGDISEKNGNYRVVHFLPQKAFPEQNLDYNTLGMYLNAKIYEQ